MILYITDVSNSSSAHKYHLCIWNAPASKLLLSEASAGSRYGALVDYKLLHRVDRWFVDDAKAVKPFCGKSAFPFALP
jgi:hypothetical protein